MEDVAEAQQLGDVRRGGEGHNDGKVVKVHYDPRVCGVVAER
jgi:hypothetical protein